MSAILESANIPRPPSAEELPYDDGEPMETDRHRSQMELLIQSLEPWLQQQGNGYVAGNMFVYFNPQQVRTYDFKGPDVFVALDVDPHERKSWVVWEEGKGPDIVIELLSDSTAKYDKSDKKLIYQNRLRAPEYYWFDPFDPQDRAGFALHNGVYIPIEPDEHGHLHSQCLNLDLVLWDGVFHRVKTTWLRWAAPQGELLLTETEIAQQQAQIAIERADAEEQRANTQEQRAEALAAKLRKLGIDPNA